MPTKLKIRLGHIEFEYEGEAVYDNEAVKDLFSHIKTLMVAAPAAASDGTTPPPIENGDHSNPDSSGELANLGIQTVAARLSVKSASDLAIAAAAHLQICLGKGSFDRRDLHADMKAASGYYTDVMSSNLTKTLNNLVGAKRLNSLSGGQMQLSATETISLKARLAQA